MNSARVYELGEVPADARLPTEHGDFRIKVFHEEETGLDHVALLLGDMEGPIQLKYQYTTNCVNGNP